jgi:hypothetical protein
MMNIDVATVSPHVSDDEPVNLCGVARLKSFLNYKLGARTTSP